MKDEFICHRKKWFFPGKRMKKRTGFANRTHIFLAGQHEFFWTNERSTTPERVSDETFDTTQIRNGILFFLGKKVIKKEAI